MKKLVSITIIFMLAISFLIIGNTRAEAMNNESAAMLAGAIAIFGKPVLNAIVQDVMYPGQAYPAQYRYAYPTTTRYIERTEIIYVHPKHKRLHRHWGNAYKKGYYDEWNHLEYQRGREDAYNDFRHHDDDVD